MGANRLIQRNIDANIILMVKVSKKFMEPNNIYVLFSIEVKKNVESGNYYFPYFNLAMHLSKDYGFDNYYNFGIGKLGKRYTLKDLSDWQNITCLNPFIIVSQATENPNPEYDVDESGKQILPRSKTNSNAIASAQEANMNRVFSDQTQPTQLTIDCNCSVTNGFLEICKLASSN